MPELLRPGVFVREVAFGPQPIEGVSTSTAGFVGVTERGPTEGAPTLVTSFLDFERAFGGALPGSHLWYAVRGFFDNGGRRAFVVRITGDQATRAGQVIAPAAPAPARGMTTSLRAAPRLDADPAVSAGEVLLGSVAGLKLGSQLSLVPIVGNRIPLTVREVVPGAGLVRFDFAPADRLVLQSASPRTHHAEIAVTEGDAALYVVARDLGSYGNRVSVLLEPTLGESTQVVAQGAGTAFVVANPGLLAVGDSVQVTRGGPQAYCGVAEVTAVDAAARTVTLSFPAPALSGGGATLSKLAWRSTVSLDGMVVETLDGLSARVTQGAAVELQRDVAERSRWIRVYDAAASTAPPDLQPGADRFVSFAGFASVSLASGSDGNAIVGLDVIGRLQPRTGLAALEAQQGISVIAAPGLAALEGVGVELLAQCERTLDRFAVLETTGPADDPTEALTQRSAIDSKYAAMYYPWVEVLDPLTRQRKAVPPSGHVLGAYARTDNDRGVFKAPASVSVRGILRFSREVSDGEQELLNPAGVNVMRRVEGLGDVIWGARTISSDALWRYVPVRRLFIFLEQSIIRGTRFAVFEPNDARLWARLRDSITNFLTSQWRAGALFGSTAEEAFFVKVDETTTTQDDRDSGRVNIVIGIAPVRPAEFVVFEIGQAPSSIIVAERS